MKSITKLFYSFVIWIIIGGIINTYFLKLPTREAGGLILGIFIFGSIIVNFVFKARKKEGEKYAYCFPDPMAKMMKNVNEQVQYEGSLLSTFFIMIGLIAFNVYMIFFTDFSWWFKGFSLFNSFWGVMFMLSAMVTTYNQYVTYMNATEGIRQIIEAQHQIQSAQRIVIPTDTHDNQFPINLKGGSE